MSGLDFDQQEYVARIEGHHTLPRITAPLLHTLGLPYADPEATVVFLWDDAELAAESVELNRARGGYEVHGPIHTDDTFAVAMVFRSLTKDI
jgi:hypothetical protein